jgi:glutathione synthase/RimK-type ligase-like ATP-grasp enzyme
VIREYIPNDGDIRVFCVGYSAIGAMKRTPPKGDFRSNISVGGSGTEYDLSKNPKVKEIAEKFSRVMELEIAGVDVMIHKDIGEPYILEINPGPQFMGLEKYTKTNAALEIIKYFEFLYKKR